MKKITFAIIIIFLVAAPAVANKYLDSLYRAYRTSEADTAKYDLLYMIISEQISSGSENYNPGAITGMLDRTIEELRVKKDLSRLGSFLGLKADLYHNNKKYDLAIQYYDSSIQCAEKSGDKYKLGMLYISKAQVYQQMKLFERAVRSVYKAIEVYKKTADLGGEGGGYFTLGNMYFTTQQYDLALKAYLRGAEISTILNDTINVGLASVFCALSVMQSGDLKLAEEYIKKGRPLIYSQILFQPFYYYFVYGRLLKKMNRNEEALRMFEIAVPLAVKGHQLYQKVNALCEMAEIYIGLKRFDKAKQLLDEAKTTATAEGAIGGSVRRAFSLYYEATGKHSLALKEYKIWQALKDSSNQKELSAALSSSALEAEYNQKDLLRAEVQRKKDEEAAQKLRHQKLLAYSAGIVVLFIGFIAFLLWRSNRQQKKANTVIAAEKQRSDDLLLNILPYEVAEELKQKGHCQAKTFSMVTVMFMDFKDFTKVSENVSAELLVDEINVCFSTFDGIIQKYRVEKIKTIGDAYICAGGLPVLNQTHAKDVIHAAFEIRDFMIARKKEKDQKEEFAFEMRIGIHTGPVVAGIVGVKKFQYDIWGDTVNLAARMEQSSEAGKINISGSTHKLVKEKFNCTYRGKIEAKNKGEVEMYFVENLNSPE